MLNKKILMPLIIICGNPSVGKTTYAKQISEYFTNSKHKVVLLNEEALGISKALYKGINISRQHTRKELQIKSQIKYREALEHY
jgi:tRNA uridine 5-carbamoylmethylation protein Kti12